MNNIRQDATLESCLVNTSTADIRKKLATVVLEAGDCGEKVVVSRLARVVIDCI